MHGVAEVPRQQLSTSAARAAYSGILSLVATGLAATLRDPAARGLVGAAPFIPGFLILFQYHARMYRGIKGMTNITPKGHVAAMWIALLAPLVYLALAAGGLAYPALAVSAAVSVWLFVHGVSLSRPPAWARTKVPLTKAPLTQAP